MNSEANEALINRLRQLAKKVGGPDALARKSGIPRRTLGNYLSGRNEPKLSALIALARTGRVSLDWLATGEGQMEQAAETRTAQLTAEPRQKGTDGRLLGRLYEAIQRVHREEGSHLPMAALAEIAAAKHDQIVEAEDDPEERLRMVKLVEVMVREELRAAATAPHESKQRA